jgi:predicted permease
MWRWLSRLVRTFTQARGFAVAALVTVAVGIAANTVVLSLFDRLLFRPLPFNEPDRLVQLYSHHSPTGAGEPVMPLALTLALARDSGLFNGIGWATGGDPEPLVAAAGEDPLFWLTGVTTGSLDALGVPPVLGPGFAAMRATRFERPVLLTYDTWRSRYSGSDDVLSLAWTTRDEAQRDVHWRVVGVLPKGFMLPSANLVTAPYDGIYGFDPELDRQIAGTGRIAAAPFARLAPGISVAAAQARVNAFVASRFPYTRHPTSLASMRTRVSVVPLQSGMSTIARPYVWIAVAGAWAVLAATSLTLTMLLLTWNQSRRRDAGVRLALGASARRLVLGTLLESVVICTAGAIVGWLAYAWVRPLFVSVLPQGIRAFATDTVDVRLMMLTGGIALVGALAAGILPAIRMSRIAPLDVMRPLRSAAVFERVVEGATLLGVQAAFGVMLLVGAFGVLPGVLRTLLAPPGFDSADLYVVDVPTASDDTASNALEQTRRGRAVAEIAQRLSGVVGVSLAKADPFSATAIERSIVQGLLPNRSGLAGLIRPVDADFFQTVAVPFKAGEPLSRAHVDQQAMVAVVNEAAVRSLWPGLAVSSAVGRSVTTRDGARKVIGVASDFSVDVETPAEPTIFLPLSASEGYPVPGAAFPHNGYQVVLRMAPGRVPDTALLSDRLRELPWTDPRWVGVIRPFVESVDARVDRALEKPRLLALIIGTLAGIALLLTVVAMYGLANFEIRRRRDEMTVRLALGATPRSLRRGLALAIVKPVAIGALAGLPFSWIELRLIGLSLPFVNAGDLQVYLAAAVVVLVAALVAAWIPGRRFLTMQVGELLRSA